jgi:hypothetical protein
MRKTRTTLCLALAVAVAAASAGLFASTRQRMDSQWRDRDIAIDGDSGDWPGPLRPVDPNHPIMASAVNDGQSLYLVLSTSDASVRRQILRQGLIVWFDPTGGEKKHFGIKFPVGLMAEEPASRRRGGFPRNPAGGSGSSDPGPADPARSGAIDQAEEPVNRLEVYGPNKDDAHNFVTGMAPGIAVKIGQVEGYFVYELKVPLTVTADRPYAIEAKPGGAIGLGLETPKVERPSGERSSMGGFGRGGRGGRGMGGRGGQFEPVKPLKIWASLQLAAR